MNDDEISGDQVPSRPTDETGDEGLLRDILNAGESESQDHDPGPTDALASVQDRSEQLRQRKIVGIASAAVALLLIGGVSLAATRPNSGAIDVAGGGANSTRSREGAASSAAADDTTIGGPGTTGPEPSEPPTSEDATTIPAPSSSPSTSHPILTSQTPRTTIGPTLQPTLQPSTTTTTNGNIVDCGRSTPSGWPTTTMAAPSLSSCLVDAFNRGQRATLTVVLGSDSDYKPTRYYEVIALRTVRVQYSTNTGAPTTPPGPIRTCRALTDIWPDAELVQPSDCV